MASGSVFRLGCLPQQYAWGKIGKQSKVAQYAQSTPGFALNEAAPYAELWMGTHPSAPSVVLTPEGNQQSSLLDVIKEKPTALLGDRVSEKFAGDLPFLFKVLSIEKALSIQAHPDKALAEKVHRERPEIYKDGNHKPEMAIALTPFEALSGFRPLNEIASFLTSVPEFRAVVGEKIALNFTSAVSTNSPADVLRTELKQLFGALMTAPEATVQKQLSVLLERIRVSSSTPQGLDELVVRLNSQFPGDVGCFCIYVLNYLQLEPGQAIFLAANLPHAYISGDCVECMATSDNVVRAGLTPKYRDVALLVDMLGYEYGPASSFILAPTPASPTQSTTLLYHTPVPEFDVSRTHLKANESSGWFDPIHGPSILIVTEGDGKLSVKDEPSSTIATLTIQSGHVYFVGSTAAIEITGANTGTTVFRAFCLPSS